MATLTGTVVGIQGTDKKVSLKIQTDEGKPRTVSAWKRIRRGDEWVDNPVTQVQGGQYGTFTGEYDDWQTPDGEKRTSFMATEFSITAKPEGNGSAAHAHDSTPISPPSRQENREASFALAYSKDIVCRLIEMGLIKDDIGAIQASWVPLADGALEWLKQNS